MKVSREVDALIREIIRAHTGLWGETEIDFDDVDINSFYWDLFEKSTAELETLKPIWQFQGLHRWLSNFTPCEIAVFGLMFGSMEAAYQAAKCKNVKDRKLFVDVAPGVAKRLGRSVELRDDWNDAKLDVMRNFLRLKFMRYEKYRLALIATGERVIVEGNKWGDTFWGVSNGVGENNLGKLIMEIREELQK